MTDLDDASSDTSAVEDPLSLSRAAREAPARIALESGDETVTFAALERICAAVFDEIERRRAGRPGPVALHASNSIEVAFALGALLDQGVPFVPLHPRLTREEARALIEDAGCSLALEAEDLATIVRRARAQPPCEARARSALDPESIAAIVYTSGTTGTPKGALLSRRAWIASARASAENLRWLEDDRWLLCLPLCHVGGLSVLTRCWIARRTVLLLPRFDERDVLDAIERRGATLVSLVPTMLQRLIERDERDVLSRPRAVLLGGAAAPRALLEACAARRIHVRTTYGLTEACSQVTTQRARDPSTVDDDCGAPLEGVELAVRRDDGVPAPQGEVGSITVRGPMLFSGYHRRARRAVSEWFDTGDFGFVDERGRLHVVSRRTDLIVTGGENVYPLEVERVIAGALHVKDAMVFGVEDATWGQLVACALVVDERWSVESFARYCRERLAPHKRPRLYARCEALPVLASGKVDRRGGATLLREKLSPVPALR